ncbi:fibronectin type III domain-containing protein [Barnesiella intestinihominis]|uniref:fibronectin type III domain-containing protein n=1 Tax=Barnesiella intestinihominis TaxID=487174 RepID=UPI003966A910
MKKITSICLTIFLGVNIVSAYAARGEQLAILSEDFSAFTEGTESTPAESELSTGNAMIPMEFTHGIQWKGRGIHQAGGVCAVLSYDDYTYGETQGWIQTPYTDVRLDDGNFILRFRARSIAQTKDSLILYLQDQYSNNYYTSEKCTITDQWQTIEVPFQHNFGMGSRLAYVQIGAYNDSWLIDDIEIIQDVYDICSPHAISPKDVTFEHFTARWDAVWSATSYLTSAYYYADEEKTHRVYIAENIETTECECQVTGMEKGKTYFFTVKAKNDKYTSVESNEVQVYVPIRTMPVPELADPTDITDTGYTARWYPVERAMGYAVRHFLKHTARSDEEYTLVHEDLETITEGTFEWPGYFYDYDLNKYSKVPGWGVNMGCTVKGMIGIDNYYRDFEEGKITSPEFDLSRNDGKYTVQLNVYAIHAGDTVYVDSYCEGEKEHREYLMKTVGEHSFSVDFTNGSAQTHFTVTFSGTDKMFIDDIFVKQILRAGESYTSALASFEVEGIDNTSYTFTDLTGSESDEYLYSVASWSYSLDEEGIWGPNVYSEYSEPQIVRLSSSIENVDGIDSDKVYAHNGILYVGVARDALVRIYTIEGKLILSRQITIGKHELDLPIHGFYLVYIKDHCYKVSL